MYSMIWSRRFELKRECCFFVLQVWWTASRSKALWPEWRSYTFGPFHWSQQRTRLQRRWRWTGAGKTFSYGKRSFDTKSEIWKVTGRGQYTKNGGHNGLKEPRGKGKKKRALVWEMGANTRKLQGNKKWMSTARERDLESLRWSERFREKEKGTKSRKRCKIREKQNNQDRK